MKNRLISLLVLAASPAYCATLDDTSGLNIGTGNTVPTGSKAAAIGEDNEVDLFSIAVGSGNFAAYSSAAFGSDNTAYFGTLASGLNCITDAASYNSLLLGDNNRMYVGYASTMLGIGNNMNRILPDLGHSGGTEAGSLIAGIYNAIQQGPAKEGNGNIVLGYGNALSTLSGGDSLIEGSVLIGYSNRTSKSRAWAIGEGNVAQTGTVTLGTYATQVANASLIVGNGTDFGTTSNALVVLKDGTVKIPAGKLQLGTEDPLTPTYGTGSIRTSGALLAMGHEAYSEGLGAIAIGDYASAGSAYTTSLGVSSWALSESSSAFGHFALAYAPASTAIGYGSVASGTEAFAASGGYAGGECSIAISRGDSQGYGSIAMMSATSVGDFSIAISGCNDDFTINNVSSGDRATAIGGLHNTAAGINSWASGTEITAGAAHATAIGSYNLTRGGLLTSNNNYSWVETEALYELGNGKPGMSPAQYSNAITTLKNGRTTLTNKFWNSSEETEIPTNATESSNGQALVVEGHTQMKGNATVNGDTVLNGKVILAEAQGDISMGIYGD